MLKDTEFYEDKTRLLCADERKHTAATLAEAELT